MKFCFDLGGKTYCIPVLVRRRWPWEEVIFKDRIRDVVDEMQPNPWITGDLKAAMVKDAQVLAGIEALVHQLEMPAVKEAMTRGLEAGIGKLDVPQGFKVSMDQPKPATRAAA